MASYCRLWRLKPSPMKTPACFIYWTPVQPVSLGYTWKANNSGMTPIQYTLGWHWTGLWATGNTLQRLPESYKAGIISWWNLLDPLGVPMLTHRDHLRWLCVTLWQNTAAQCGLADSIESRMMEVEMTTGVRSHVKLQSNHHLQQTNFCRPDALPVTQPTVSKHRRKK